MKNPYKLTVGIVFLIFISGYVYSQQAKKILPRKDCFFGVHFDFHANPSDSIIGQNVSAQGLDDLINKVKPDFIQVDCKGHPGIASYPTKIGTPAKGFKKDALSLWRSETAKYGVGLYVHYSDLFDKAAISKHPGWAARNQDGMASSENVSIFSGYEDSLLIPQLTEVIRNYHVDGVWLDAGTWAIQSDYSTASLAAFKTKTGITEVAKLGSSSYPSFLNFTRNAFVSYINRYATALHRVDKNIAVCSNWMFSGMAPLPISSSFDFLSGDMPSSQMDLNMVAFNARCYSSQGRTYKKPWDLMSWGFDEKGIRPTSVLCQEAAEVIAEGGAWQCYFPQNRDASVDQRYVNALASIAPFMRARQSYCQYATPIKQIAVLFSGEKELSRNKGVFQNDNNISVRNVLYTLLDNQYSVDVIMEHQLTTDIPAYPVIVIPELGTAKKFQTQLLKYTANGGIVFILGTDNAKQLSVAYTGIDFAANLKENKSVTLQSGQGKYQFRLPSYALQKGVQMIQSSAGDNSSVAAMKTYGKGRIVSFLVNQNSASNENMYEAYKSAIATVVKNLFPNPMVEISGSKNVHVAITGVKGQTVINLVNTSKQNNGSIPALAALQVSIRMPAKPAKLTLQPENKTLNFTYNNGVCNTEIQTLPIHEMIVISQ